MCSFFNFRFQLKGIVFHFEANHKDKISLWIIHFHWIEGWNSLWISHSHWIEYWKTCESFFSLLNGGGWNKKPGALCRSSDLYSWTLTTTKNQVLAYMLNWSRGHRNGTQTSHDNVEKFTYSWPLCNIM